MKKILLRGPLLTESGYGTHSRQVARWLLSRQDVDVKFNLTPWGMTSWYLDRDMFDGLVGQIMDRSVDGTYTADVAIMLQLPNEWQNVARVNVGMTAGVETDVCNPSWIQNINQMSHVIVPSEHVKKTFMTTAQRQMLALSTDITVIPESFPDACLNVAAPETSMFDTTFNFFVFGQLTGQNALDDRKNTAHTLKWLLEEFKDNSDVGIVIKTNGGTNSAFDKQRTTETMKRIVSEVRRGVGPKLHLIHGSMSETEIVRLYRDPHVKVLVSATRGEGFGLPILEAAACNLPVIATGWSGHLDFMNKGRFIALDHRLVPIHESRIDGQIFVAGAQWADVSEIDFKQRVRKFYTSSVTPKIWAKELGKKLVDTNSFAAVSARYDEILGKMFQ